MSPTESKDTMYNIETNYLGTEIRCYHHPRLAACTCACSLSLSLSQGIRACRMLAVWVTRMPAIVTQAEFEGEKAIRIYQACAC